MTLPQQPMQSNSISAIIVNYRSWDKLTACINSLLSAQTDSIELEIIVVDNCSNDEQFANFSAQFSSVNFILNSGNHGCNFGAKFQQTRLPPLISKWATCLVIKSNFLNTY